MDKKELKSIFWDYAIDYTGDDIYDFLVGEKEIKELNRNQVAARMLTFPAHMYKQIRWTKPIKIEDFEIDRQIMLEDLITKSPNSLVKVPRSDL